MQIVRTIVWVVILAALLIFTAFNWNPVEVQIWTNIVLETKIPALVIVAFLLGLAISWYVFDTIFTVQAVEWFVSLSMALLAIQKLQDVRSFSTMFLNYDLLARRWVRYGFIYPFGEALAGILMVAHALPIVSVPVSLFIGTVGAVSVFKAVYVDKRELKCACVGGGSNVPLGFVSLTENLFMIGMGLWMGAKALGWIVL